MSNKSNKELNVQKYSTVFIGMILRNSEKIKVAKAKCHLLNYSFFKLKK